MFIQSGENLQKREIKNITTLRGKEAMDWGTRGTGKKVNRKERKTELSNGEGSLTSMQGEVGGGQTKARRKSQEIWRKHGDERNFTQHLPVETSTLGGWMGGRQYRICRGRLKKWDQGFARGREKVKQGLLKMR